MMRTKTVKIINLKIAAKAARSRIREAAYQEFLKGSSEYATARALNKHITIKS